MRRASDKKSATELVGNETRKSLIMGASNATLYLIGHSERGLQTGSPSRLTQACRLLHIQLIE